MGKLAKLICALLIASLLVVSVAGCAKPLTLSITAPTTGKTIDKSPVEVRGYVSDPKATLWVNDATVTVTKMRTGGRGYFSTNLDLNEGENTIKVIAARGYKKGEWKDVVERTVTVTYTPQ